MQSPEAIDLRMLALRPTRMGVGPGIRTYAGTSRLYPGHPLGLIQLHAGATVTERHTRHVAKMHLKKMLRAQRGC